MKRYAIIYGDPEKVAAYLPDNYTVITGVWELEHEFSPASPTGQRLVSERLATVIEGRDKAGWTLDDYVLPRLASGLYSGKEIDLSHPVMKQIPERH